MKRVLLLLALLLLAVPALADSAEDIAMAIHPGSTVSQRLDADGATLMVLTENSSHTLLMLEGSLVTVDNPCALMPGDVLPEWSFASDAVAWSYRLGSTLLRYRSEKENGCWGEVDVTVTASETGRTLWMDGMCLHQKTVANGIITEDTPIPAPWLHGQTVLPLFSCDAMPLDLHLLPPEAYQPAADMLAGGTTVLMGTTCPNGLLMLCDKPNHTARLLVACVWNEAQQGYQVTRSTPITIPCTAVPIEGGVSLIIGAYSYDVTLDISGRWGITAMHLQDGSIELNAEHIAAAGVPAQHGLWGSHPWGDIAQMDWLSLPANFLEASGCLDPRGWARVSNPDADDTLHLRQQPDARAHSLGRYYNGAPLQVLASSKDWLQVSIGGVTGWMKRDYVTQDYAMQAVPIATPMKHVTSDGSRIPLYPTASAQDAVAWLDKDERVLLLGFVGEEWYHVLAPDRWVYGYVEMCDVK